ncbi:MAG TPA: universal stress protein [Rhodocyclaceae bacterium]|jgi:nucleotide-binding universal stress UspA family protein|nr:universal stress protein [Rhodocyclaceae bacterium]HRQ45706.1 universal stress protein [Rhodocyclaceae bacterium]
MSGIQKILAATDFSESAGNGVERAAMLASQAGATLVVTNVISRGTLNALHDLMSPDASDELEDALLKESLDRLHDVEQGIAARHHVNVETSVSAGSVLREIDSYASGTGADLLVLGAHGGGFVRDMLLGSTTERVLRKTTLPMLVVRCAPSTPFKRVLVPVDFSERSQATIELARSIAPEAELILVHAFEVPYEGKLRQAGVEESKVNALREAARQEALRRLDELVANAGVPTDSIRRVLVYGQPASAILEQAQTHGCDLIAMGKQGLRMMEELVLGSVTRQVMEHAHCDVLVTDRKKR